MLKKSFLAFVTAAVVLSFSQSSHAQMFFESDWIYLNRDNDGSGPIVVGAESVGLDAADYDWASGYRVTLGGQVGPVDVDTSFTQPGAWESSATGVFTQSILLDDSAGMGAIPAGGSMLNSRLGLSQAATEVTDELLEAEMILFDAANPPSWDAFSRSNYKDFEINIGTNRACRRWRMSAGYRHIKLSERNGLTISGFFDAPDIADGNNAPGGDPNDGLAGGSLNTVGFNTIAGGDFDVFGAPNTIAPDTMIYQVLGSADNELNGGQFTFAGRVFDGDWVTVEAFTKVGIYRNQFTTSVTENVLGTGPDTDLAYQRRLSGNGLEAAFAGNIGFSSTISLTDYINLVTGYELLWLQGVATGPDQINGVSQDLFGNTTYTPDNDGSMFAHGGRIGLQVIW